MGERHETDLVPSPGGWVVPAGERGGVTWVPPIHGAQPVPERMPRWVRAGLRIPYVDRCAQRWMWSHGGFLVLPADHPFHERYGPAEYEALTGITKAEYERRCLAAAREAFARDRLRFLDAAIDLEREGDDTSLVVRFELADRTGRAFGKRVELWPSPHPEDYEGEPEWSEMLPGLLEASIRDGELLRGEPAETA